VTAFSSRTIAQSLTGLLLLTILQGCTTYKVLPPNVCSVNTIEGVYFNTEFDTINKREWKGTLWTSLDYKHAIQSDSIFVKINFIHEKSIKLTFFLNDSIIGTKVIKGKSKTDNCFYTRRIFYIIPILPVLWAFSNEQKRIYRINDELVVEYVRNSGGAFLIMAGGSNVNNLRRFKKIENKK
jgi:hypothetical protein